MQDAGFRRRDGSEDAAAPQTRKGDAGAGALGWRIRLSGMGDVRQLRNEPRLTPFKRRQLSRFASFVERLPLSTTRNFR